MTTAGRAFDWKARPAAFSVEAIQSLRSEKFTVGYILGRSPPTCENIMIATPSTQSTTTERRVAARLQPAFRTICRLNRLDAGHSTIGLVWDLSETGVSMLMADPPKPGVELSGELAPRTAAPRCRSTCA